MPLHHQKIKKKSASPIHRAVKKRPESPETSRLKKVAAQPGVRFSFLVGEEEINIPEARRKYFLEALRRAGLFAQKKIEVILSTQQVADLLNVSRPFVIKLIDSGQLKAFNVGTHRRVLETEAIAMRQKMREEKNAALDELVQETQELGIKFE